MMALLGITPVLVKSKKVFENVGKALADSF